jgi:hypothetical protein
MIMERRFFLTVPTLLGPSLIGKQFAAGATEAWDFTEFSRQASEYAKQMIADPNRNEDEYLVRLRRRGVNTAAYERRLR